MGSAGVAPGNLGDLGDLGGNLGHLGLGGGVGGGPLLPPSADLVYLGGGLRVGVGGGYPAGGIRPRSGAASGGAGRVPRPKSGFSPASGRYGWHAPTLTLTLTLTLTTDPHPHPHPHHSP